MVSYTDGKEKNYWRDTGETMQDDWDRGQQCRSGMHTFFNHAGKLSHGLSQEKSNIAGI